MPHRVVLEIGRGDERMRGAATPEQHLTEARERLGNEDWRDEVEANRVQMMQLVWWPQGCLEASYVHGHLNGGLKASNSGYMIVV